MLLPEGPPPLQEWKSSDAYTTVLYPCARIHTGGRTWSISWSMPKDKGFHPRVILDDEKLNN